MRAAIAALAGLVLATVAAAAETLYTDLGRLISSREHRYGYAYAPAMIREGGAIHMLFCSYGRPGIWDHIRHARSDDEGRSWSAPTVAMAGTDETGERAACDPSLVRYRAPGDAHPYWYLFYSGNPLNVGTAIFLARGDAIEGPYAKWTRRGTWEVDATDPAIVIAPARPHPDDTGFYGAGQTSVVLRREGEGRDVLGLWYTDDSGCETPCARIFEARSRDPTRWPPAAPTNVAGASSVDVKRDPERGGYAMVEIVAPHTAGSVLALRRSRDGRGWSAPVTLCREGCFDRFAHNVGIVGSPTGELAPGPALVVYGAPSDRDPACGSCWGKWDLFGGLAALPP